MSGMVSWRDYEGVSGFHGSSSFEEVAELNKALTVGASQNPPGSAVAGDGFAMRVESLQRTLKNTTYRMEHIRLWREIPKDPAFNTVEEHNDIESYGNLGTGAFIAEGGLPQETDATYRRRFTVVKFMGVTRRVSQVATLIKPAHGNLIAQETIAGTMDLLKQVEQNLWYARSDLDPLQWDGVEKQIEDAFTATPSSGIQIDLRGLGLSQDRIMDAIQTIMDPPNFGLPTHLFSSPKVKSDLIKSFFPNARYDLFDKPTDGYVGLNVRGFEGPGGRVAFEPDVFIDDGGGLPSAAVGDVNTRPALPVITTVQAAAPAGGSLFGASDAGQYFYHIVAANAYGFSAALAVGGALTVAAGDGVTFGVTPGSGPLPTYYKIYRTVAGGATGTARQIQRTAAAAAAGATTITDLNQRLPGTTSAFLLTVNPEHMKFLQLAPMLKIPLGTLDTSIRWAQVLYGTPVLYTPRHNVVFRNVGRSADFVGSP